MPQLLAHINLEHGAIGRCNMWAKASHALMSILFYHYFLRKNNPTKISQLLLSLTLISLTW